MAAGDGKLATFESLLSTGAFQKEAICFKRLLLGAIVSEAARQLMSFCWQAD